MKFENKLTKATLIKRYKRFLADVTLENGEVVTAHCANSGSMLGVKEEGSTVWLSPNTNPKAKLDWRWEMIEVDGNPVGINTSHPNRIVETAVSNGEIQELASYQSVKREVKYGHQNSRIDLLLSDPNDNSPALCYVEIKNVTLKQNDRAEFPDAVTARGSKHLSELIEMVNEGHRAVMFYLIQRMDCDSCSIADDIDPDYAINLTKALKAGVEVICYDCHLDETGIEIRRKIPFQAP